MKRNMTLKFTCLALTAFVLASLDIYAEGARMWAGAADSNTVILVRYGPDDFLDRVHAEWELLNEVTNIVCIYALDYGPGDALAALLQQGSLAAGLVTPAYPRLGATFKPQDLYLSVSGHNVVPKGRFLNTEKRLGFQAEIGDPDIVPLNQALDQTGSFWANYYTMYAVLPNPSDSPPEVRFKGHPVSMLEVPADTHIYDWASINQIDLPSIAASIVSHPASTNDVKWVHGEVLYALDQRLYDAEIASCPEAVSPLWNRGAALYNARRYELAIEDFTQIIDNQPLFVDAYSSRGEAYNALGKQDRALADFKQVLKLDPERTNLARLVAKLAKQLNVTNNQIQSIGTDRLTTNILEQTSATLDKAGNEKDLETTLAHLATNVVITVSLSINGETQITVLSKEMYTLYIMDAWARTGPVFHKRLETVYEIADDAQSAIVASTFQQTATMKDTGETLNSTGKEISTVKLINGVPMAVKVDVTTSFE